MPTVRKDEAAPQMGVSRRESGTGGSKEECSWTAGSLAIAEHAQAIWIEKGELKALDWAEADVPVVNELLQSWN